MSLFNGTSGQFEDYIDLKINKTKEEINNGKFASDSIYTLFYLAGKISKFVPEICTEDVSEDYVFTAACVIADSLYNYLCESEIKDSLSINPAYYNADGETFELNVANLDYSQIQDMIVNSDETITFD